MSKQGIKEETIHSYGGIVYEHDHHSGRIAIVLFFIGLAAFLIGLFVPNVPVKNSLYFSAFILSGYHIIIEGFGDTIKQTLFKKRFSPNVHILMTLAAVGAIIIGEYREAALLILIFAGAHYLEDYAENKSKREITTLLQMNPTQARRLKDNGEVEIVDVAQLAIGDHVSILNGDQVPTDGKVVSGESAVDEAAITGESIPVTKQTGDELFGSTINGTGTLVMEVTKDSSETVFAKIIELVSETQTNVSPTAALIKRIEPRYVIAVIIIAPLFYLVGLLLLNWSLHESFYRTMVLLIAASPCALAVTDIPATLAAISHLAKRGVLFKGGSYLANVADINAIAFDKTGTLTEGKPAVTDTYFSKSVAAPDQQVYEGIIVAMERKSNHPLATAIIEYYDDNNLEVNTENKIGVGLVAKVDDIVYKIGKPTASETVTEEIITKTEELEHEGKTVVHFSVNDSVVGLIALQDIPKDTAKDAINYFKGERIHTLMLTGDAIRTGKAIGRKLQLDEVRGNILPEEKATIITEMKGKYPVMAMLGDGVNDAPALVRADVGVAMGEGTDIAIDVADAVLMKNDLTKFAYTHGLSKKLRKIVLQNIWLAMSVVALLFVLNIIGQMNMAFAVVIHEGSTLLVLFNGLRMLKGIEQ